MITTVVRVSWLSFPSALACSLVIGCGASSSPEPEPRAPMTQVDDARFYAAVPMPVDVAGNVEDDALAGAKSFLEGELARNGGAPGPSPTGGSVYVFQVAVGTMEADPSGRTRASVSATVSTQDEGRIVGTMRGTATAFVERGQPLAVRQQRAIEGALEGALRNLPTLLSRLEQDPRHANAGF